MEKVRVVEELISFLDGEFPDAKCELKHRNLYELTIATILSAQCTDEMVNRVTPFLFSKYPDFFSLSESDIEEVKEIIRPTGFFNNKAKSITSLAKIVVKDFGGKLPLEMEKLVKLPGIGRKTANVLLSEYGAPAGVVVDTHVKRVAKRLGLTSHDDPTKIENDLIKLFPKDKWGKISHQLIHFGRGICLAKKPKCNICKINAICLFYNR